ncbi:TPA: alpha/beta fold hydrolase [Legionella pneumophila]|uniref:Haloalkane dehalogenase n=1 Tax=Legionella waltersii TaxID=66969 RepID=A0A0W1A1D9_9GAMM|nr:alpha/beta fold hydrolase [Legionella waltersii]HAU3626736.1 alpha/beta fold hydrolase [Legionella pneumophila]KTD74851.1 haloalkane dehalogenase [Legionella waltersii]SNV11844.1 acetoin dehydrogenase E2 subunit dihydrolipoyllysine-residue acetyltransferase [Legionella waltersii]HAU3646465.1 alpha/beta fold hydrolase [Legionella pneumophila]HAU3652824.1 alpha/beta fold hydrolase [Legionella pneumophila]
MIKFANIIFLLMLSYAAYSSQNPFPVFDSRINVGNHKLHVVCQGKGSPTVILEAGSGTDLSTWSKVQPEIAKFTRVCSYSRAGLGKSSIPKNKIQFDALKTAKDLHVLLNNPLIKRHNPPPYILVGHSYGGLYVRNYLEEYPDEVAGMVLVEATSGSMNMKDYGFSDELVNALIVLNEKKDAYLKNHSEVSGDKLKATKQNPELIAKIKSQSIPNDFSHKIDIFRKIESKDMDDLDKINKKNPHMLGNKPLVVIIAEQNEMIHFVTRYRELKHFVNAVISKHQRGAFNAMLNLDLKKPIALAKAEKIKMLALSTNSILKIVKKSGHNIHIDQPEIFIKSVKQVVFNIRGINYEQ